MKSLPIVTLAASCVLAASYAWSVLLNAQEKPPSEAAQPDKPAATGNSDVPQGPRSDDGRALRSAPIKLRRNEKSAATAVVTLGEARRRLTSYRTVKANIEETIVLEPRRFKMKGSYIQGTDLKLRLQYDLQVGGTKASLIEVCDGQILWTWQQIGAEQRVTRRNVRQILSVRETAGRTPRNTLIAELGLGGLPGLLASIERNISLEEQWETTIDDRTLVVVEGTWKETFRRRVAPNLPPNQPLPQWVPDRIRIYFEQDSLFPRRIRYLKRNVLNVHHPMVTLDFVDVEWNSEVDPAAFTFVPPEKVVAEDVTQAYLKEFTKAEAPPAGSAASGGASTPKK